MTNTNNTDVIERLEKRARQIVKLEKSYFKDIEKQNDLEKKALILKVKKRNKAWKIHNLKYHTA